MQRVPLPPPPDDVADFGPPTTLLQAVIEPATALYALLFDCGTTARAVRQVPADAARRLAAWLGRPVLAAHAERLLTVGRRLAQEWVGYERLVAQPAEWWRSFAGKAG